jgi:oligogalacturonide lyase
MAAERGWTRRAVLFSLGGLAARAVTAGKKRTFPSERVRYADPATEFTVFRLTSPEHTSYLPSYPALSVARRQPFLLYSSDRTGLFQAFRLDRRTAESRQLTEARELDVSHLTLAPDNREFCCFDGPVLRRISVSSHKEKEVWRTPAGSRRGQGLSVAPDSSYVLLVDIEEGSSQLRLAPLRRGMTRTLVASPTPLANPLANPRGDMVLYRRGEDSLWVIRIDGQEKRQLATARGRIGQAYWSPDGRTILYLSLPEERGKLNTIREFDLEANVDRLVAETSQFVHFAPNADASIFVGASGSLASPYVLLLERQTKRELTLCEHAARNPEMVAPVFAPDSRSIYFGSDRHGKPAVYWMPVEGLVEPT